MVVDEDLGSFGGGHGVAPLLQLAQSRGVQHDERIRASNMDILGGGYPDFLHDPPREAAGPAGQEDASVNGWIQGQGELLYRIG